MNRPVPFRAGAIPGALRPLVLPAFTGTYTLVADASEFQPDITDAVYLAWSRAIIIRALYGDAHDDKAWYGGERRAQLHAGGVKFLGIYQYLVGTQSGAAQAQAFHKLVGAIEPGEVFIADFEEGAKGVLSAWYNEMLKLYGAKIGPHLWTYSGLNFGAAAGVLPVEWIAAYQSAEPTWRHKLWQFTDRYSVPGVGSCDCSVFHGSIDQLAALAYAGTAPAPSPAPAPVEDPDMLNGQLTTDSPIAQIPFPMGSFKRVMVWRNFSGDTAPSSVRFYAHGYQSGVKQQDSDLGGDQPVSFVLPDDCNAVEIALLPGAAAPVGWTLATS